MYVCQTNLIRWELYTLLSLLILYSLYLYFTLHTRRCPALEMNAWKLLQEKESFLSKDGYYTGQLLEQKWYYESSKQQ